MSQYYEEIGFPNSVRPGDALLSGAILSLCDHFVMKCVKA